MKLGTVVQEVMSFKEKIKGRTDDGQGPITIKNVCTDKTIHGSNLKLPLFVPGC